MAMAPDHPLAASPEGVQPPPDWHATHAEAGTRLRKLAQALAEGDWTGVDAGARWIYDVLRPHNEAEERELFPCWRRSAPRPSTRGSTTTTARCGR